MAAHKSALSGQLADWLVDAGFSVAVGAISSVLKARSAGQPLFAGPIRKFALSFAPTILAGAILTLAMLHTAAAPFLPGLWLLLYGAGLAAAGTLSIWVIPVMGACFISLGVLALAGPAAWSNGILMAGFAGIHCAFGFVIARRHGG